MTEKSTDTAAGRLPGDLAKDELIDRIIRVDHAGEFGAKRIYEGQLAVLRGKPEAQAIEHMYAQELEHLKAFEKLMVERRVRPSALHPLWNAAGFALDVTKRDDCIAMAKQVADKVGQVTILVNNAGIVGRNGMTGADEAVIRDWENIISVNLTGGIFVNQSAAFSDFHASGCNPAANASLTDSAFVAPRFHVVQARVPVAA